MLIKSETTDVICFEILLRRQNCNIKLELEVKISCEKILSNKSRQIMPSWCLPSHLKNERDSFETNLDIISKEKRSNFQAWNNQKLVFLQINFERTFWCFQFFQKTNKNTSTWGTTHYEEKLTKNIRPTDIWLVFSKCSQIY